MARPKGEIFRITMFFVVVALAFAFSFSFSNWGNIFKNSETYELHANFEEIGNLRIGSPVKIAGVLIGKVNKINLNKDYQAEVLFRIAKGVNIPEDSSIRIVTQGILGGNYLSLTPGISEVYLRPYANIYRSHSAFVMENFINKAIATFSTKGDEK